jgi:hypothetical protein
MISMNEHTIGVVMSKNDEYVTFCVDCTRDKRRAVRCSNVRDKAPTRLADAAYKDAAEYKRRGNSVDANGMALAHDARDTSREAVARNLGRSGTKKRLIYDLIAEHDGLTDDEILTGHTHQSASSSRNRLMNDGFVYATQERRRTRQGEKAIVWKIVP